jgi:transcriptional regulator with XRE-family HTH domain
MSPGTHLNAVFAIRLKQLRKKHGLTLTRLAAASGLSQSYLAEIEGGKKYPKPDRIGRLAAALNCSCDELMSSRLDRDLEELNSFIGAPGIRESFAFFGITASDVVRLLARSPLEVTALLRTLSDVAKQYDIGVEHFLNAALRSLLRLTDNTAPEIDRAADKFARSLSRHRGTRVEEVLRRWLQSHGLDSVDQCGLANHSGLHGFRSILVTGPATQLLLNPRLNEADRIFSLAREVGYRLLGLKARSLTAPADPASTFEQVRNDFHASYFAGALLLPRNALAKDLRAFFKLSTWQPDVLLGLLGKYNVTPTTLFTRIGQLLPTEFGLRGHLLEFEEEESRISLVNEVNLSTRPAFSGIYVKEHHCRRWLGTRLLGEFRARMTSVQAAPFLVGVQLSRFNERENVDFFNLGIALAHPLRRQVAVSLVVGCEADDHLMATIRFAADPAIHRPIVGGTCERCGFGPELCAERAAPPTIFLRDQRRSEESRALQALKQTFEHSLSDRQPEPRRALRIVTG